ncbi:hypothetical protein ACIQGZ_08240 [Streptomyces sp. NPDC092296]|uniref:hypothetical protein n=1 Tax=Streptomyces sp. NPDC092296 TaxID=3366012 RepID=UPI00381BE77C
MTTSPATPLPSVTPLVAADAVELLTPRLRKKLDAAIERISAAPVTVDGEVVTVVCGEDAVVTLRPSPSGTVTDSGAAQCSCLLAPRCLHRAAVLGACPVTTAESGPSPDSDTPGTDTPDSDAPHHDTPAPAQAPTDPAPADPAPPTPPPPSPAQVAAAAALWSAAAAVLAAGTATAGAVLQADLLRAAHSARLAGLLRAEAAALRTVRGLRAARTRQDGHRTADLVTDLSELLLTSARLAAADPDPSLIGTARRDYRPDGGLRVFGVCREPVISATGYAGVVTHLIAEDGRQLSLADVKPGGPGRAVGAATAPVALSTALDHAGLARGGLLVSGATVSPDGRLGAGRSVRAHPVPGLPWSAGPLAGLFARPPVAAHAAAGAAEHAEPTARQLIGCDLLVVGTAGEQLLTRQLGSPAGPAAARSIGPVVRLSAASHHPDLAHLGNLRLFASRPGLRIRVVGHADPDRAATLRPLAVGPVPGETATLRLPDEWLERADLGYDRLQGRHLPPAEDCPPPPAALTAPGPDPLADSPLWRVRSLVELAVTGGRRAAAEAGRSAAAGGQSAALRRAGLPVAAELAGALTAEADRRGRDVFGRLSDPDPDRYARSWLAAAVHLTATERALVHASWTADPPS